MWELVLILAVGAAPSYPPVGAAPSAYPSISNAEDYPCVCGCELGQACRCTDGSCKCKAAPANPPSAVVRPVLGDARRTQWLMFTGAGCLACQTAKADFEPWLKRSGWKIDDTPQAHIRVIDGDRDTTLAAQMGVAVYPTFILLRDGVEQARYQSYPGREPLAKLFVESVNGPAAQSSQLAVGDAAQTPMAEVVRVIGLLPKPEVGFIDFGCGFDARFCVAAAEKWKCKVTGVEIDPDRAAAARERVKHLGLDHLITIIEGDALTADVDGDVAVVYLFTDLLAKLKPRLEKLRAVASYQHEVPGLKMQRNGESWIYRKAQPVQYSQAVVPQTAVQTYVQPAATWGGYQYSGPICNSPNCQMCRSIRAQLGQ